MQMKKRPRRREILLTALIAAAMLLVGGLAQRLNRNASDAIAPAPVRFSRVMSANRNACYAVNRHYYDWIELQNFGEVGLSLRGWRLADTLDLRDAYVFGDVTLQAGDTLLVYCDKRPADAPEDALFTGFRLDSDGELLVLADPYEHLTDTLVVPALKVNWVYRREDSGEWTEEQAQPEGSASATFAASGLRLNELMPANHATLADTDGDYPDWIELYNAGDTPVNLEGYALSDTEGKQRWRFPALSLGPGEYLVVFSSGKNRVDPNGELHTNFSLSAGDAAVTLYDRDGKAISRLACDTDEPDVSISLDDAMEATRLWPPTPGYHNSETGLPDEMPLLSENAYDLYINEVMSVADGTDWAELINDSTAELDLSDMGLSDNPARPRKWQFPAGTRIPAGGCLLVALAGGDEANSAAYTADFGISAGETLCLSLPDGTIIDRVKLFALPIGASYGRAKGEPRYRFFSQPTPGKPNAAKSYARQTAEVVFSQPGGLHDEASLSVALSSDPEATIYYTLDGSEPNAASNLYREPLVLNENTTVRAVAWLDGCLPSAPSAATYILNERHPGLYTVCVSGDYEALIGESGALNTGRKQDDCDVFVEIYDESGTRLISQACNLMVSGHSSRQKYAQKAFRLKARSAYGDSRFRAKLFSNRDYTVFKSITLRASGQDNQETHIRDSVLSALAADTSVMYLESEAAVVYVDGHYWGLYNLRERVTPEAVAQFEGWNSADDIIIVRNGEHEEGNLSSYTVLMDWLAGADLSVPENLENLKSYVDVENYLDYVALEMYICNLDLSNVRCYCNPAIGAKWKWIFFDLDLSYRVDRNMARDWLIPGGVGTITQQDNTLFIKLMENAQTRDYFLTRMGELLRTTFSSESVIARFQARCALIEPEMPANCARWGWSIDKWHTSRDKFTTYAQERPAKLVEYLSMAFQLSDGEVEDYFGGVR